MVNAMQNIGIFVVSVALQRSRASPMLRLETVLKHSKGDSDAAIFVGFLQLAVAFTLMINGALWIVRTTQNSELFLNTLALSYIMDIDELVFQTIVPRQVSYIISNMDGLPLQQVVSYVRELKNIMCPKEARHERSHIFVFFLSFM